MNIFQMILASFVLAGVLGFSSAIAEPDYDLSDDNAAEMSKDDIIAALTPKPPLLNRSVNGEPPPPLKLRAVPLRIQFDVNSYELTDQAQEALNNLGAALVSDALSNYQFRVEGHTDASGSDDYNMELSKMRAQGVRNYLVNIFEMQPDRLESVGRGEGSLIKPDSPNSPDNRVVLIVNLGPKEG